MMAKESDAGTPGPGPGAGGGLDGLIAGARLAEGSSGRPLPPVHLWDPPFCGAIDMHIARDGTWFYGGTPIGRPALVRLFSTVLRKDDDGFVLVTPVEKVGITVEDAPFLAVEAAREGGLVRLRTNVDDWFELGPEHPLRFEPGAGGGMRPYALVRDSLWALVSRPVFYELVEEIETRDVDGVPTCGIASGSSFFPIMAEAALAELVLD